MENSFDCLRFAWKVAMLQLVQPMPQSNRINRYVFASTKSLFSVSFWALHLQSPLAPRPTPLARLCLWAFAIQLMPHCTCLSSCHLSVALATWICFHGWLAPAVYLSLTRILFVRMLGPIADCLQRPPPSPSATPSSPFTGAEIICFLASDHKSAAVHYCTVFNYL